MNQAYKKDLWRSMTRNWKRFLSILIITMLGVTMMTGIYAACLDMYYSADRFFDRQNLFDIRIVSTLGLTEEDVKALNQIEGVEIAEGGYGKTVNTFIDDVQKSAEMIVLSQNGINAPYLLEGTLPSNPGEIAVTQKYLDASGKSIGDMLVIEEDIEKDEEKDTAKENESSANSELSDNSIETEKKEDPAADIDLNMDVDMDLEEDEETAVFSNTNYIITGTVLDPMDIQSEGFGTVYRSAMAADYTFFICSGDADSDIFTAVYLILDETKGLDGNSDEYEAAVQAVTSNIESRIKKQRELDRYNSVIAEARKKIEDAEKTISEKFEEADGKFADAWKDIDEGRKELEDGEATISREQTDAAKKISEARAELEDGKQKLANAEAELLDGEKQLAQGEAQLNINARQLEDGKLELESGRRKAEGQLAEGQLQLEEAQSQLDEGRTQLEEGLTQLKASFGNNWPDTEWNTLVNTVAALTVSGADDNAVVQGTAGESAALSGALKAQTDVMYTGLIYQIDLMQDQLDAINVLLENLNYQIQAATDEQLIAELTAQYDAKTVEAQQITAAIVQMNAQAAQINELPSSVVQAAFGMGKLDGGQLLLNAQKDIFNEKKEAALQQLAGYESELAGGEAQIAAARKEIEAKKAELEAGRADLEAAKAELTEGEQELNTQEANANREISDARQKIKDGRDELEEGEAELTQKEQEYADKKEEVDEKISDAYAELNDIDMTQWYVQDRYSLDSYSSLHNDLSSIEAVGKVFPIIFLSVAALMSLTTMTRMVEEERGLIGTYQALGFKNAAVYRKYLMFAMLACLIGGIIGDLAGFILFPEFLSVILAELYTVPYYYLRFDMLYGIGGVLLFLIGIMGATIMACRSELTKTPADLMRPKAPRAGSRVFLERIPLIWNRLRFLNKVTVRNLFRFKKRLLMTVGGIMGCTALVLCGFSLRDTIVHLAPRQYEEIYNYDLMAAADSDDNDSMLKLLDQDENIAGYLNLQIDSIKLVNASEESEKVQMMVIPDGADIEKYIHIQEPDGTPIILDERGICITRNAAQILGLGKGDSIYLQNMQLEQYETIISGIAQNYLGNNVYITQSLYVNLFGEYAPNGVLAHLTDSCSDPGGYAESLTGHDEILSAVSTAALKEDFGFDLINAVVLLLIVMAGGLAFVVLFTLSNTNISERVRELATIKVLGFYDNEVQQYVHKETLTLTLIGILAGLPAGRLLSGLLSIVLELPSIYFAVHVEPVSYLITAAITLCFAVMVNLMTNRTLNRINMVEALKSVE